MPTYRVTWEETTWQKAIVEAESAEAAEEKIRMEGSDNQEFVEWIRDDDFWVEELD
jgi:hypothetical protein